MTTTATATAPRRARRRLRLADGVWRLRMMTLAGIATVLITRAYLAATGYPRIGGGGIHIGHVVWGGLLMIAALTVALVWAGDRARVWTALLGGVGIGLFVDEVGKYLTTTNDYFYRPAAAIIYLVFAALLVEAALLGRDTVAAGAADESERLASAAQIAATGLISGLTPDERDHATRLLDGCPDQDRDAVLRLLAQARHRDPGLLTRLVERVRGWAEWVAGLRWTETVVFVLLIVSRVIVAIVFIAQAAGGEPHSTDAGAITASAFTRGASAVLTIAAVIVRIRGRRMTAYRLAKSAILLDLIVTEVFNFHDSQFGAVAELPHLVLGFVFISIWQRQVEQGSQSPQTSPAS
ncbi:hypothetical protein ABH935_008431 [Catenulispora sp. GAS73]|uniref:hypothetical protein n=1 Tax=Catenulispora sp. GAS73 TaxID=3156269 RepID=UPI003511094A